MEIDLKQLKEVTNRLLDHLIETRGVTKVSIEQPFYWDLPLPETYDVEEKPPAPDVGSLVDDWEFLSGLLEADADPVAYQLTELTPLIRYIGLKLGKELASKGG